jgi:UDP-N-acetylmuramoyl-L-alanyl-D-glutamate--2,6-diaminopimelate ligase
LHDLLDGREPGGPTFEVRGDRGVEVHSVVHDDRDVIPGALFCCIAGTHDDGHDYAPRAVVRGAAACLVERWVDVDVPQVRVRAVRAVLGPLCARFHGGPSEAMRVLGVTGTNGKTTTTHLLEAIAGASGDRTGLIGTTGARIGTEPVPIAHTTPEATDLQALLARMRDEHVGTVAMEVSSHALAQQRVDGTSFAAVAFTNLSHDHLDFHGGLDAYFAAKARLFTPAFSGRGAVCLDDPYGKVLADRARLDGLTVSTFATDVAADVTAEDIRLAPDHTVFTLAGPDGRSGVRTPLIGAFNVRNALAAAATARLGGIGIDAIVEGLGRPVVVPGRMERVDAGQPFPVFVDYAHTPGALEAVLEAARPLVGRAGRLLVVFGCGGDRDRAKRPVMGRVAARLGDVVFVTSDNPRSEDPQAIVDDVLGGVPAEAPAPEVELDRRGAIRNALLAARPGDVVVVAGKGHETGQTANGVTRPFDDRVVVREELEARA